MKKHLFYFILLFIQPAISLSQSRSINSKLMHVGGTQFGVHDHGVSFGVNPIFLIPIDTLGNFGFAGEINNTRVIGKFALSSIMVDTIYSIDPIDQKEVLVYTHHYISRKHGEWNYFYGNGYSYREYYDKGELVRRDSLQDVFKTGIKEIKIVDSMARIRSIIDLYIYKGDN